MNSSLKTADREQKGQTLNNTETELEMYKEKYREAIRIPIWFVKE